ncbi:MAG: DUF3137 domain-containing protein [Clostridiales bacterium]|nr:DUF3137 domain-containing protein [Clostridiales bacterium]
MGIRGISKKETYQQLAEIIDAEYIEASVLKGGVRVEKKHKIWTIFLDTFTVNTGSSTTTFTRVRAPFVGYFDFRFKIGRINIFTKIARFFGKQYLSSGDYVFDDEFFIKGNDEERVKDVFENDQIKNLFRDIKRTNVTVKKSRGRDIVDEYEINYITAGVVKDCEILKDIFNLFEVMLDTFEENHIAKDEEAQIVLYK